jgi:cysteinyl-tRNA synthetase
MSRAKQRFVPLDPHRVTMYVCGPTVYDRIHIGNARPLIFFDVVRRYLQQFYTVQYIVNITDVDDKIIRRASERNMSMVTLAEHNIEHFFADADALRIRRATHHPRVTDHVPDIISFIAQLLAQGCAYLSQGDVYFRTSSFPSYGKLSRQPLDLLQHGIRIVVDERKESANDFVLWKAAKPGEMTWTAPWGEGRPGWHIECSTMARKFLGDSLDIHGGGADLHFPHHECEIAQSESLTGKTYVRYWMHNAFIQFNSEKMSKSLGNVVTVHDLVAQHTPEAIRYLMLATHYRNPLQFSEEALRHAQQAVTRLGHAKARMRTALEACAVQSGQVERHEVDALPHLQQRHARLDAIEFAFHEKMRDDWNTPDAITAMFELVSEAHAFLAMHGAAGTSPDAQIVQRMDAMFEKMEDVLGLFPPLVAQGTLDVAIEAQIVQRNEARKAKDYVRADAIRQALIAEGIYLEDTAQGVRWYRK